MSENKGCGCGKKNVQPEQPPAENPPAPQENKGPQFRNAEVLKDGIKKN